GVSRKSWSCAPILPRNVGSRPGPRESNRRTRSSPLPGGHASVSYPPGAPFRFFSLYRRTSRVIPKQLRGLALIAVSPRHGSCDQQYLVLLEAHVPIRKATRLSLDHLPLIRTAMPASRRIDKRC